MFQCYNFLYPKQLNNPDTQKVEYNETVAVGRRSEVGNTRLYTVTWMYILWHKRIHMYLGLDIEWFRQIVLDLYRVVLV